jgi:hypothetical protein
MYTQNQSTATPQSTAAPRPRSGYRIDADGRLNNYAIEPEMYISEPGDLREQEEVEQVRHRLELEELQEDEAGKLTAEHDLRHKGPGLL